MLFIYCIFIIYDLLYFTIRLMWIVAITNNGFVRNKTVKTFKQFLPIKDLSSTSDSLCVSVFKVPNQAFAYRKFYIQSCIFQKKFYGESLGG